MATNLIQLKGRVFVTGDIAVVTGLHIGGAPSGLQIGGVDNTVLRDPVSRQPYIPGSSLKGKMRSLAERQRGFNDKEVQSIGKGVRIHICQDEASYRKCPVCPLFGAPGEKEYSTPTRLTVRDVFLDTGSLANAQTDFLSTEVKWEAAIDRVTSAAVPRQIERVPAKAVFRDFEMVLSLYDVGQGMEAEYGRLRALLVAMQLLEDDYLGAAGSRGSGKVKFEKVNVAFRKDDKREPFTELENSTVDGLLKAQARLIEWEQKLAA